MTETIQHSVISVLIEDESGALARVVGLFSGRGYNIESLTVALVDAEQKLSRITVLTSGTPMVIRQIKAQLKRLIPVHDVSDLTEEGPYVGRELALVKIVSSGEHRTEALRIADSFRARPVDTTTMSFVFELTGSPEKIDAFIELMRPLGLAEVSRTGIAAIGRGPSVFHLKKEPV
ncbi:acetolactate synthase small subunit [Gluconobacter sp.]|uniref:acetolactate synthase small subunit n=1 Tax=Gluconobacter sp. TaxID=1876758 RepID=UPI0039EA1DE5